MKTRLLIIIAILTIIPISVLFTADNAYAICMVNSDWSDRPCYGCIGCYPGLEQEKLDWEPYHDFKGATWMDAKKKQLEIAIHNNSLDEWFEQSPSDAHHNVHQYYFLQGDVQNRYGMNFSEVLYFEKVWNAVENSSRNAPILLWNYHDVILDGAIIETDLVQTISGEDVPLHTIKVNKFFKGEQNAGIITAMDNFDDLEINLFENGLFYLKKIENQHWYTVTIASVTTFGNCDARDLIEISYSVSNEKKSRSVPVSPEKLDDPCVPHYYDVDPDKKKSVYLSPLKQFKSGTSIIDVTCKDGLSIGYKKDLSKAICVTPETLFKLDRKDWVFSNHGNAHDPSVYGNDTAVLCTNPDDEVVSFGYSKRESNLTVKVSSFERIQYNGLSGALITYDREFDGGMSRGANNGYFPYVHCINESVDTFDECMNVSHHFSNVNYPIISCLTLDGKKFSYDEIEVMSKNSGIELYTMNYLSSALLEFVGKTDRIDQEISFSITAPSGKEIFTWSEFAPNESEFRTVITTGGPLWKQEDGVYTFTAKQIDVPYYLVSLEFELKDGEMVR